MSPLLTALLLGLRANCEATICAIDTFLTMAKASDDSQRQTDENQPPPPPAPEMTGESPETCAHQNLVHAPVMGNPGRFICQNPKCKAEVNK